MENKMKNKELYIKNVFLSREIPNDNYLKNLPVISNLKKIPSCGNRKGRSGLYMIQSTLSKCIVS